MDSLAFNHTQTDDEIQQIVSFLTNSVILKEMANILPSLVSYL